MRNRIFVIVILFFVAALPVLAQKNSATLDLVNKSNYTITVKIMRCSGGLFTTRVLYPFASSTVYFTKSGQFYTKTKAEKTFDTIYKRGNSFEVYCEDDGYTSGSLEFYVSAGSGMQGQSISKAEFDSNE